MNAEIFLSQINREIDLVQSMGEGSPEDDVIVQKLTDANS